MFDENNIETLQIEETTKKEGYEDAPNVLAAYFKQIRKVPLLTADEEYSLALRAQKGDEEARQRLISSNLRLVVKIAKGYVNRGVPFMDLIEEGNIGLMKGVERFKPEKGCRFSTYGSWWIKQAVERAIFKQSRTIRVPVHICEDMERLKKVERNLTKDLGREPTVVEAANETGFDTDHVKFLKDSFTTTCSLDAVVDEDGQLGLGGTVADENSVDLVEKVWEGEKNELLNKGLERLGERHREVVRLRFGMDSDQPLTLKEVGEILGVTRERARQIEIEALGILKSILTSQGGFGIHAA